MAEQNTDADSDDPITEIERLENFWQRSDRDISHVTSDYEGLGLGLVSVDFRQFALVVAQERHLASKLRHSLKTPQEKARESEKRRKKRAARPWDDVRTDSINRKSHGYFKLLEAERDPDIEYAADEVKAKQNKIDNSKAWLMAMEDRLKLDEDRFLAMVNRYAAFLGGCAVGTIQTRHRRNPKHQANAELALVMDARAVDVLLLDYFDADAPPSDWFGVDLAIEMVTPRSDLERRDWLISAAHAFFKQGNLFPTYVTDPVEAEIGEIAALLMTAGALGDE